MVIWQGKDCDLAQWLEDNDISGLRATCQEWRAAIDATLSKLQPLSLDCPHLSSR